MRGKGKVAADGVAEETGHRGAQESEHGKARLRKQGSGREPGAVAAVRAWPCLGLPRGREDWRPGPRGRPCWRRRAARAGLGPRGCSRHQPGSAG